MILIPPKYITGGDGSGLCACAESGVIFLQLMFSLLY